MSRFCKQHHLEIQYFTVYNDVIYSTLLTYSLASPAAAAAAPFYNWTDEELDTYLIERKLPNEFSYFDPTKVESNRECGLHI